MANPTLKRKASTQAGADKNNKKAKSDSHKQQHTAKHDRKSQNRHSDMITEAKKIWETLRRGDISREETKQLMDQIMGVIKGHVQEIIFKHDASRIIQTCLKKGNSEQKNEIAGELTGKYLDLSKSMYGKFIALKALEYCPKQRDQILSEFRTHIRKLIRHKEASTVVEAFFAQFSNAAQRRELLAEFYGPEMTLFNRGGGAKTLDELLKNLPEKKDTVLKFMAETLTGCMDKGTVVHSIVHTALYQYLTLADDKARQDMFAHLRDNVQDILHTREGSKVAIMLVSYASPKDRKHIVKNFKPYLTKIAEDQYGYLVLLRLLDVTDDTVLINKAVVSELLKHAQKLFNDKYGRRIFLYILAGRNTKYLSPETVKQLKEADAYRNSKKDPEIRSKEILEGSSPLLIQAVAQHASTLLRESLSSQIVRETMLHAVGDKSAAIDAILDLAGESIEKDNHIMENPFANRVIKAMVKADTAEEANDRATEPLNFAPKLLERIKPNLAHFATNYGSFVVVALLEEPSTKDEVAALLKPHKKEIKKAKEQNTAPGAQILLELL